MNSSNSYPSAPDSSKSCLAQLDVDSLARTDHCHHQPQHPQAVIDFIQDLTEPVLAIIDFDETLFLRNSTEEYLSTARPRFLCAFFLICLDKLKPWNVLPLPFRGTESRDWLRVLLVTLLFPWTWLLWRRQAKTLMTTHENHLLSQALAHSQYATPVIASRGFEFIIQPLARYLSIQPQQMIGCRFWAGGRDRHKGKEELIADRIDDGAVQNGMLVTDSTDDASLLDAVKYPFLVQWPGARYVPAFSNIYLPFFYLERVKRPGSNFTYKVIVKNHLLSLILAVSWLSFLPLLHVVGTIFLVFSFWCIYEVGYFENDQVAEKYEKKPVLSETYHKYKSRMDVHQPWIFASISGLAGVSLTYLSNHAQEYSWAAIQSTLLQSDQWAIGLDFTLWMGILLSIRGLYLGYNYLDEKTRVWIYPFLQISKYLSFLVFTHASKVGLALLIANIFVDWVPYIIYRCGGQRNEFEEQIMRLFIFLLICAGSAFFLREIEFLRNWQFAVILLWLSLRIRPQLKKLISNAHWVWH